MTKKWICCVLLLSCFGACHKEPVVMAPTPTAIPIATPIPEIAATPAPTPSPEGPDFNLIRMNREIMNDEQTAKYGNNMKGKHIGGWVGYFHKASASAEEGKMRVVIDMDENAGGIPDVILENIPSEIAQQFQPRQGLNFSGSIQGYVDIPDSRYSLSIADVKIYGYLN